MLSGGLSSHGTERRAKPMTFIWMTTVTGEENIMLMTRRKPVTAGEMLRLEFLEPLGLTQAEIAAQMGVPRKHVNEICMNRRAITADTALMLARVFGNSADFWLNLQRRTDLWEALHTPVRRKRIQRARPLRMLAAG